MSQPSSKAETSAHPRSGLDEELSAELGRIRDAGLERRLRVVESEQGPAVVLDGRRILLFCSNNYLGLASRPEVVAAAREAARRYGASAVSSRLISGHMRAHAELEELIAEWKGCERALAFTSGYQANIGAITHNPLLTGEREKTDADLYDDDPA